MKTYITGIGWVTATGMGCAGNLKTYRMTDEPIPDKILSDLLDPVHSSSRRMDHYSKLGLAAISYAMQDAGMDNWSQKRHVGIIVATEFGCLNTDIDYFDTVMLQDGIGASPALFSYTLPNVFLGEAAIRFGLTGPTFVINDNEPSGLAVIDSAIESIRAGEVDKIICGACEAGKPTMFGQRPKPFSGALFFVIESAPGQKKSYGRIRFTPGGIEYNGQTPKDLNHLVRLCLRFRKNNSPS